MVTDSIWRSRTRFLILLAALAAVGCTNRTSPAPASASAQAGGHAGMSATSAVVPVQVTVGDTQYTISASGTLESTVGSTVPLARRVPLFSVKRDGRWYSVTKLMAHGATYRAEFDGSGVSADFDIKVANGAVVVRLVKLWGDRVQQVQIAHIETPSLQTAAGHWLTLRSGPDRVVALISLDDSVHTELGRARSMTASVYPAFGMEGRAVAIVSVRKEGFLDEVHNLEIAFGLPSPKIDGVWAKRSPAADAGYLLTDLTQANADKTIRYAKLGNFKYVLIYSGSWSSSLGSYPINLHSYPDGEAGLKATIAKLHAAGLKVGMHILTSEVSKNDPLVRPKPDPRLLKDASARLQADIDAKATQLVAEGPLTGFSHSPSYYDSFGKQGIDIQIDDEILQCPEVGVVNPRTFSHCTRGFAGTEAAPHRAGARIEHLAERFGKYLVDLHTSLKDQVATRLAGLINRDGFDMIHFDGGEADAADGPAWYWVGQEELAIWKRVKRPLFMLGGGGYQLNWHLITRVCAGDYAAVGRGAYLDSVKIPRWETQHKNFMAADLGWWGLLTRTPSHPATTPEDAELVGARMLALDAPLSVETTLDQLEKNGRSEEVLRTIARYDRLRLSGAVPPDLREKLRSGDWLLLPGHQATRLAPVHWVALRTNGAGRLEVTNNGPVQPLRFQLRCLPSLAPPLASDNVKLFRPGRPMGIRMPVGAAMPGALAYRARLEQPSEPGRAVFAVGPQPDELPVARSKAIGKRNHVDLVSHRALAVTLDVDGPPDPPGALPGVLNVQLESTSKRYRDYFIDLDFRGRRTITIDNPDAARTISQYRPARGAYRLKAALYTFDYDRIMGLDLRWMRFPSAAVKVKLESISAVAERPTLARGVAVSLGKSRVELPTQLHPGDYADYDGGSDVRVFDHDGKLLATGQVADPPLLGKGTNLVRVDAGSRSVLALSVAILGKFEKVAQRAASKATAPAAAKHPGG